MNVPVGCVAIKLRPNESCGQIEADEKRSVFLLQQGYRVLRFWDNEGIKEIDAVMYRVAEALTNPHPDPLPGGEREKK